MTRTRFLKTRGVRWVVLSTLLWFVPLTPQSAAQFQKSVRSKPPGRKEPVYCPTIDFNGSPSTTQHPISPQAETIEPPLVPPATEASAAPAERQSTPRGPSQLDQLRQQKQRSMEDILRRIQAIREQIRSGQGQGGSAAGLPAATADFGPDRDAVPLPDPGPVPSTLEIPGEPPLIDPADSQNNVQNDSDSGAPATASDSPDVDSSVDTAAAPDSVPTDPAAAKSDPARRFSELMNALTKEEAPPTTTAEPPPAQQPGYMSATTVLDSPVDRLKLADNLFATGEVQLALTMYEAVKTKDLSAEDRHWHTYQQACCHRRLGMFGAAESIYRQLAGNSDAGDVSVMSRWWLERLEDRKELEAQADQIRTLIQTYKQAQANAPTASQ